MNAVLNKAQIAALLEPFDYGIVENRASDGQRILPHHWVRARLSEIFGPLGWSEQTLELTEVPAGDGGRLKFLAYRARVRVIIRNPDGSPGAFWDGSGAWGQGRDLREAGPTAIWDLHSDCMNGALSVAFLRATKNLGNAFGLSLYDDDAPDAGRVRVRHFLPYAADETEEEKEPTQYTLDLDEEAGDHERQNDPT